MQALPWALAAVLAALLAAVTALFLSYRARLHRLQGRGSGGAVPAAALPELDPVFRTDELGPTLDAEVRYLGGGALVPGGTSDTEAWVLAALAKRARLLFEFGTATGRTAYLWARNSPPDAEVVTLTLAPAEAAAYAAGAGDSGRARKRALDESRFTRFRYTGTDVEGKVTQLFGDSKQLDVTPWAGRCDLVFVDGSHAFSYVKSDTEKALRLVAPGGIVLWHDYRGPWGSTRDVHRYLNELGRTLPLVHLKGTTLVAHRAPPPPEAAP